MWEGQVHRMCCHPWADNHGVQKKASLRKQDNKKPTSSPPWSFIHFLHSGSCPDFPPGRTVSCFMKWILSFPSCFWSWCFVTAIEIKPRKVCSIYVAMRTRKYLFESCFRQHFSEKQSASSYCSYKVDQINTFTTNVYCAHFFWFVFCSALFKKTYPPVSAACSFLFIINSYSRVYWVHHVLFHFESM